MVDSEIRKTKNGWWIVDGDTHIGKWVEESGRLDHDRNMLPLVEKEIQEGDCVIDVGAFIGDHTLSYARSVGELGRVYAFEPFLKSFECLKRNMEGIRQVECHNIALGAEAVKSALLKEDQNTGASYLVQGEGIEVRTLDSFGIEPNFIKIDAEGWEPEILLGAKETLEKYSPKLLLEVNKGALERRGFSWVGLQTLLQAYGYSFKNIYPNQGFDGLQFDILCIKEKV